MVTNKSTIEALKRMYTLINDLQDNSATTKELKTWNKMFKWHIAGQKRQDGKYAEDSYECDWNKNIMNRFRNGKLVRSY